jgi:plastocyanin
LAVSHGSTDEKALTDADLELGDFYFGPTVLTGKPGEALTLHLSNTGAAVHNFSLQAQGIDQDVQAGQKDVAVKVTFPGSGAVVFICKYHAAQNMQGELTTTS